jgi:hypothetical protein
MGKQRRRRAMAVFAVTALPALGLPLMAQETKSQALNPVDRLQQRLEKGEVRLTYAEDGHGYLRSLLDALNIPVESQVMPFTRSSFLAGQISPKTPRTIYFSDDVAVGVAPGGNVVELIANDRANGPVFFTFPTRRQDNPRFTAEIARCTFCHNRNDPPASTWIVANIAATPSGQPHRRGDPDFDFTDHATRFEDRWGGWYVTGTTPAMRHRGNATAEIGSPLPADGLTLTDLSPRFDVKQVLMPSSDIVALMTLEHQTGFANRAAVLNARYSEDGARALAAYMSFRDEVALPGPVSGNSGFSVRFAAAGPRDAAGRSLREFDLKTRLFRRPLSYMIYSNAFDGLTPEAKRVIWRQLHEILRQTPEGREAIAIVVATKPDVPAYWKQ